MEAINWLSKFSVLSKAKQWGMKQKKKLKRSGELAQKTGHLCCGDFDYISKIRLPWKNPVNFKLTGLLISHLKNWWWIQFVFAKTVNLYMQFGRNLKLLLLYSAVHYSVFFCLYNINYDHFPLTYYHSQNPD